MLLSYLPLTLRYYRQHGLRAAMEKACEFVWGRIAHSVHLVYVMECRRLEEADCALPPGMTVDRRRSETEMEREEVEWLSRYFSPEIVKTQLKKRFERNASLWLARRDGKLVAYNWTLNGEPIDPFFLPFTENDANIFDGGTLKEVRGQGSSRRSRSTSTSRSRRMGSCASICPSVNGTDLS